MKRAPVLLLLLLALGCARESATTAPSAIESPAATASVHGVPLAPSPSSRESAPRKPEGTASAIAKPARVEAPADAEVASFLRAQRGKAVREGRAVLVEVGATWCKPCKTLKEAIARGELDEVLDGVTIIAFDADAHGPRLDALGYKSKFIPYFAVPKPDGNASEAQLDVKIPKDASAREIGAAMQPIVREAHARSK